MDRIVNISRTFKEADEWTKRQHREMTPNERMAVAWELKLRAYGPNPPDVREGRYVSIIRPAASQPKPQADG
jgi:hypothetical protein